MEKAHLLLTMSEQRRHFTSAHLPRRELGLPLLLNACVGSGNMF